VPESIHDDWPRDTPRLTDDLRDYYATFVAAARDLVTGAQYSPAHIGGCPVPELTERPFVYSFKRDK
jgi:hypothetical protein